MVQRERLVDKIVTYLPVVFNQISQAMNPQATNPQDAPDASASFVALALLDDLLRSISSEQIQGICRILSLDQSVQLASLASRVRAAGPREPAADPSPGSPAPSGE